MNNAAATPPSCSTASLYFRSYGISDIGMRRSSNQDSFLRDDTKGIYLVADGVGGLAKGEIASAEAVDSAYGYICSNYDIVERYAKLPDETHHIQLRRLLESAVQAACYLVYAMGDQDPERKGMSTTLSLLLTIGTHGMVAQVGDSRIYQLRATRFRQLTEDHTLLNYKLKHGLISAEGAAHYVGKNVITRAVGHSDYVQVDTNTFDITHKDRFILCSDGLHGHLSSAEIHHFIQNKSLEDGATTLVNTANARGGSDNITVLIVDSHVQSARG